jgi:Fe-S oxidoreductase
MKQLIDFKEEIHKCSKCGLCQAECLIYKITGNDCCVSRGHFSMLDGLIKGKLKMSKTINRYLDLCLKCGACEEFCPSGINVIDVMILAKSEYFKKHPIEKCKTFFQKYFGSLLLLLYVHILIVFLLYLRNYLYIQPSFLKI